MDFLFSVCGFVYDLLYGLTHLLNLSYTDILDISAVNGVVTLYEFINPFTDVFRSIQLNVGVDLIWDIIHELFRVAFLPVGYFYPNIPLWGLLCLYVPVLSLYFGLVKAVKQWALSE